MIGCQLISLALADDLAEEKGCKPAEGVVQSRDDELTSIDGIDLR
jgi:hypothetical protein